MVQFDMIKAMPGGIKGLKAIGDELHRRSIRALWPGEQRPAMHPAPAQYPPALILLVLITHLRR